MNVSLLCALLAVVDGDAAGTRRVMLPQASAPDSAPAPDDAARPGPASAVSPAPPQSVAPRSAAVSAPPQPAALSAPPRSASKSAAALAAARKSLARGQLDSVLVHLQQPGAAPALEAQVLIAAAEKAHQRKDEPLALQLAQLSQQRDPAQPLAARRLGEWSLDAREFGQAQRYAKLWLDAAPSDVAAQHFSLRVRLLSESWHPPREKPSRRKHDSIAAANAREYPRDWNVAPDPAGDPAEQRPAAARAATASSGVILYGTSWCPYCRKAREHLRQRGVAFTDRDIEKEPAAQQEMGEKERAHGLAHRGVPVLDIHGTVLEGFSAQAIDEALKR